jgi:hypothetical protein
VEALPQLKREGDGYYAEVRFLSARSPFFDWSIFSCLYS